MKDTRGGWFNRLLSLSKPALAKSGDVTFPSDFMASLERLRLLALKAMGGGVREGHRLGAYKGGQLEFHGHRNYSPGDELRYVDWNTYARLGKPYVKEFAREEAGVLHLLIDATASMSLGHPSKWTFARRVAALFHHVALSSKDLSCLYIYRGTGALDRFPGQSRQGGTRECLAFLEAARIRPAADADGVAHARSDGALLDAAVQFLRGRPVKGRVIVISDFWYEEQEIVAAVSRLTSAGYDLSGIHVLAEDELATDAQGAVLARSLEEEAEVDFFASGDFSSRYTAELEKHRASIEDTFRRRGGSYLFEKSSTSIERVLIATLRQRRWVM